MFLYQNNRNQIVNLYGDGVVADPSPLMAWTYSTTEVNGKIAGLSQAVTSLQFSCAVYGGNETRDRLFDIPAYDRNNNEPGKLYFGDWYLVGYLTASTPTRFLRGLESKQVAKYQLTFTTDDPLWHLDSETIYTTQSKENVEGLDFDYDMPHDYGVSQEDATILNQSTEPADVLIRMYGLCDNPSIRIAGNVYGVDVSLLDGEFVEIDTWNKKVELVRVNGERENVFSKMQGEYLENSGSYIFQKIPSGYSQITWGGGFDYSVIIKERRAEPRWN